MSRSLHLLAASALLTAFAFTANPSVTYAAAAKAATGNTTPAKKARTPQQQRMADCSHKAKLDGKKDAERRAFMSSCLKGHHAAKTADTVPRSKVSTSSASTSSTATSQH